MMHGTRYCDTEARISTRGDVFEIQFDCGGETLVIVMPRSALTATLMRAWQTVFWAMPAEIVPMDQQPGAGHR